MDAEFQVHLKEALLLVRDFRKKAFEKNIDARALRVAIKYMVFCDDHFAKDRLTPLDEAKLTIMARNLFDETKKTLRFKRLKRG